MIDTSKTNRKVFAQATSAHRLRQRVCIKNYSSEGEANMQALIDNGFMSKKNMSNRRVLNVSEETKERFSAWCDAQDGAKYQQVATQILEWFMRQEPPVQSLVVNGLKPIPPELYDATVTAYARLMLRRSVGTFDELVRDLGSGTALEAIRAVTGEKSK